MNKTRVVAGAFRLDRAAAFIERADMPMYARPGGYAADNDGAWMATGLPQRMLLSTDCLRSQLIAGGTISDERSAERSLIVALLDDTATAQPPAYSSWRCHHMPVSLRPSGARSSHEYMPQSPSTPRP